ncbi:MAG: hypothetical protein E6G34_01905 [Actinobacteria bacterium]|nr:MAG: hypothetical protein E6G34_01905 [Actinomycetota bacterium]
MTLDHFDNWDPGPLEPGERLFLDTGKHREMAMIDYSLTEDRYIVSYREAGEVLATHVMHSGMSDLLVFPILFAYRHWLELELKSLITLGQQWRGENIEPIHTHKLEVLWPLARAAIEAAFPDDPADLDTVGSIVDELVAVDPASMSFRYARDRTGGVNLPAGLERVNVGHIATVMSQVGILLDGAADAMADMLANADDLGP